MFEDICDPQQNITCGVAGETVAVTFRVTNTYDYNFCWKRYFTNDKFLNILTSCYYSDSSYNNNVAFAIKPTGVLGIYFSPLLISDGNTYYANSSLFPETTFSQKLYVCGEFLNYIT